MNNCTRQSSQCNNDSPATTSTTNLRALGSIRLVLLDITTATIPATTFLVSVDRFSSPTEVLLQQDLPVDPSRPRPVLLLYTVYMSVPSAAMLLRYDPAAHHHPSEGGSQPICGV
jgi:hypothetical protein